MENQRQLETHLANEKTLKEAQDQHREITKTLDIIEAELAKRKTFKLSDC